MELGFSTTEVLGGVAALGEGRGRWKGGRELCAMAINDMHNLPRVIVPLLYRKWEFCKKALVQFIPYLELPTVDHNCMDVVGYVMDPQGSK